MTTHQAVEAALDADADADADAAILLGAEAKELRLALERQLMEGVQRRRQRQRRLTTFQEVQLSQLEVSIEVEEEEEMSELILLVSQYSEAALQKSLVMALGSTTQNDSDNREEDDDDDNEDGGSVVDGDYTGRYPLHLACDTNAPVEMIQFFLHHEPTRQAVRHKDKWQDLPLHTACSRGKDYTKVVELLLEYDTPSHETVWTPRYDGSLPIHTACRYNAPPRVIQLLLDCDTATSTTASSNERKPMLFVDSLYGQVPLHVASRCNLNPDSLQLLLDYDVDKQTVLMRDNADRLPLHVAYLYGPTTTNTTTQPSSSVRQQQQQQQQQQPPQHSIVELILRAMIHGRIERVGLIHWKHDMHTFVERLGGVPERDFNASDKLELTCQALQTLLLERAILLELAIWKTSCCSCSSSGSESFGCGNYGSAQQQHEDDRSGGRLSTMGQAQWSMLDLTDDYKRECRIKSGAEMIIPGVLSFLEDEPIAALREQIGF